MWRTCEERWFRLSPSSRNRCRDFRRTAENERVNDSSVCSPLSENEKENKDSCPQKQNKLMFPPDCYKVGGLGKGKIRIFDVHVGSAFQIRLK